MESGVTFGGAMSESLESGVTFLGAMSLSVESGVSFIGAMRESVQSGVSFRGAMSQSESDVFISSSCDEIMNCKYFHDDFDAIEAREYPYSSDR